SYLFLFFFLIRLPPRSTLFPYTTLFRSGTNRALLVIVFKQAGANVIQTVDRIRGVLPQLERWMPAGAKIAVLSDRTTTNVQAARSEEHTSELQSRGHLVCRLLLEKKNGD